MLDAQATSHFLEDRGMRLGVRQVGGVDQLVQKDVQTVGGQVGIVPGRGPPGIREQPQFVPALAQ